MPETESFDAFYARTVWDVTSQMHALAGDDNAADHAIREAYAMAYQQWYQVSRYPDPDGWVLTAAKEAYQRRRPNGPLAASAASASDDNSTWPGIYRPSPGAARPAEAADGYRSPSGYGQPQSGYGQAQSGYGQSPSGYGQPPSGYGQPPSGYGQNPTWSAAAAGTANAGPGSPRQAGQAGGGPGWYPGGQATALASPDTARPTGPGRRLGLPALGPTRSRTPLIAAVVGIVVIAVAVIGYVALSGGHKAPSAAGSQKTTTTPAKPKPHMLAAGQTGRRSAIPWTLIGAGWTVAETSTSAPGSDGGPAGSGQFTTYLVDPKGGKYSITTSTGTSAPQLIAWSGNARYALYETVGAGQVSPSYSLLSLRTGNLAALGLPANVNAVGFTRPDGLNILAVKQGPALFKLQRYSLTGAFQATIGQLPRKPGEGWSPDVCGTGCSALSSPDGDTAVWGIVGDEMQLVSNAGGLIHKLHVPDSGTPPSCVPISWWDETTVLADCDATNGSMPNATRLWLVPTEGGTPSPVSGPSGSPSGSGFVTGAWTANGTTYVTSTDASQCPSAATGPGGLGILPASQVGSGSPVSISGSTGNHNGIVAAVGDRLLVLAQTSCPGTSSLLWYRPADGSTEPLLTEPSGQVGVIAAVAFGFSPEAVTNGFS
jgi:hypothetical protein